MTKTLGHCDVLVVGAGITGISTALSLAESGVSVVVVERYHPAAMASGWTLAGVRQSGRDPAETDLAQRAVSLWKELDGKLGRATGYRQTGNLRLARNATEAEVIQALVTRQLQAGLDIELLDASALNAFAPHLSPSLHCASLCSSDGQADPIATSNAYRCAAERSGVRFQTQTSVNAVNSRAGKFHSLHTSAGLLYADSCLLATGIQTNELLEPFGHSLPIQWALVNVMQSTPCPPLLTPVIGVANADLALRQQADGCLRMTSGAEFANASLEEENKLPVVQPSPVSMSATLSRIANVLPATANMKIAQCWGGLLDMTPDGLPVMDHVPGCEGLVVAAGFSGHGFGIGPAVGETLAQLITQEKTDLSVEAFTFDRFDSDCQAIPELHG